SNIAMTRAEKVPGLKEDLAEIYQAGQRAAELVRQILTFSRHSETSLKPLKIGEVISNALKMLRSTLPSTIEIQKDLAQNLPPVLADPTQIYQIIMNLCTNGGHAMEPDGGILSVSLNLIEMTPRMASQFHDLKPGPYLELKVCDTGCGIPESGLEYIFDPYFTTKKLGEGTGLGLSVVHGIIKHYGGDIKVESKPGQGACFFVYFKTLTETLTEKPSKPEPESGPGSGKILVVDDEPTITKLVDKLLRRKGYDTVLKNDSQSALALFKQNPQAFDLVLTDMTMPHLTGDHLARKIVGIRPECPVILMTGYSKQVLDHQQPPPHISAVIMKPISTSKLLQLISSLIQKP
ncbi:MAG: ATP-binding protein, partial [Desulfobacterales bacterium]|nr:ATP-binding protein [Desulfobacterales bacterium]